MNTFRCIHCYKEVTVADMNKTDGYCDECDPMRNLVPRPKFAQVLTLKGEPPPSEVAQQLRDLADRVENGEIPALVMCYEDSNGFNYIVPCIRRTAVFLADMLHQRLLRTIFGDQ